jgi:hypothetical protein
LAKSGGWMGLNAQAGYVSMTTGSRAVIRPAEVCYGGEKHIEIMDLAQLCALLYTPGIE